MGAVIEMRPRFGSDWTLFERTQLEILIEQAPGCEGRDLVFGVTDAGDPWCVALDDRGEVVLHVARINGRVVVHAMAENVIAEGHSLSAAMGRFINEDLAFRRSNVAQLFPAQTLPAHMFGALGEAEALPVGDHSQAAESLPSQAPPPAAAIAAASALPAFEAAESRFAWDAAPLSLDGEATPAFAMADPAPAATAAPRLIMAENQISIDGQTAASAPEQIAQAAAQVQTFNASVQAGMTADASGVDLPRDADTRSGGDDLFTLTGPTGSGGTVIVDFATPRPPLDGLTPANDQHFVPTVLRERAAAQDEAPPPPTVLFFDTTAASSDVVWPSGPPFSADIF